jgi:D-alanine-D-alanine ligase
VAPTREALAAAARAMLERHERVVLKPLAGGSSRGLVFLDRGEPLPDTPAIPYIVEQFVRGRELTVGVSDQDGEPLPLPAIEIEVDPGFSFDYLGKYLGKGTREICPAQIPDDLREEAQRVAVTAHEGLGCEGYSRTDLIAADDGLYFLELNTLPGLTTSSLVPQQLRAAGIGFREFLERQLGLAVMRLQPR